MSAFEDFIQVELPRRPWVATDPAQETIPVRRGAGPRQLDFVTLTDGQVLGKVNGTIQGITVDGLGGNTGVIPKSFVFTQPTAANTWTITHNQNSEDCVAMVFDANGYMIMSDALVTTTANTVTVEFTSDQDGKAVIVFAS